MVCFGHTPYLFTRRLLLFDADNRKSHRSFESLSPESSCQLFTRWMRRRSLDLMSGPSDPEAASVLLLPKRIRHDGSFATAAWVTRPLAINRGERTRW
jgi:hypothetical protein